MGTTYTQPSVISLDYFFCRFTQESSRTLALTPGSRLFQPRHQAKISGWVTLIFQWQCAVYVLQRKSVAVILYEDSAPFKISSGTEKHRKQARITEFAMRQCLLYSEMGGCRIFMAMHINISMSCLFWGTTDYSGSCGCLDSFF